MVELAVENAELTLVPLAVTDNETTRVSGVPETVPVPVTVMPVVGPPSPAAARSDAELVEAPTPAPVGLAATADAVRDDPIRYAASTPSATVTTNATRPGFTVTVMSHRRSTALAGSVLRRLVAGAQCAELAR